MVPRLAIAHCPCLCAHSTLKSATSVNGHEGQHCSILAQRPQDLYETNYTR
jgi:hypothetical protein